MLSLNDYIALTVNEQSLSLQEVLTFVKWRGLKPFLQQATDILLIREGAAERGISVTPEELQRAADDFRLARDLEDVEATETWLLQNYLTFEEWEEILEFETLRQKLIQVLVADKVERHFAENRLLFDTAVISHLVVEDEGVASELRAQIIDDEVDFHLLARQHSIDKNTRMAGGYVGLVARPGMDAEVESGVFGGKPGKVVGPIHTRDGWELIRIESLHPGELNIETRQKIEASIFEEWLKKRREKARIECPPLEGESEDSQ